MRAVLAVLVVALGLSVAINIRLIYRARESSRVIRVVDGDSFDLADGRRIRLLSVDAPEKNRCGFEPARQLLSSLLADKHVRLTDVTTDDYGRLLANVFVGDLFVNEAMLQEGVVRFTYVTSSRYEHVKEAFARAKAKGRGIWGPPCRTISPPGECIIKGNLRHGEKMFYLPSCKQYINVIIDESFGDLWFCSQEEAQTAGFIPAPSCSP